MENVLTLDLRPPETSTPMKGNGAIQINEVNERIKVGAVFEGDRRVTTKWFFWRARKHEVRSVEHSWRGKEGETPLLYLTVTDGANVYQIQLNQSTLEWRLDRVYMEG